LEQGFFPEEYSMNLRAYILLSVAAFLLLIAGCQQNPTEPTATKASTISGTVFDAGNKPLALARVVEVGSLAQVDTSKTDGSYKLTLQLTTNYNTSLYAILPGYASDTPKVSLTPGDNLTGINIHMIVVDSSKIVSGTSGPPASIGLLNQTAKSILLKGGINQSSTLTFLVVDSLNRPVTSTYKCKVKFSISVSHPSGESLKPDTAQTDPLTGQVSTTVFSGTQPNAILVTAQVIDPTRKITATAALDEGTGLPDGNHVSISATKFNIAGRVYDGLSTSIALAVNDQFGNPVADGTPVSFVTNGGGITGAAFTNNGVATAILTSGGGNPPVGGLVTVTAEVKGDTSIRKSDSSIVKTIQILFSGHTTVTRSSNTVNFEVPDGDMNYFDFTVSDDNGKPLVEGSTINVTVDAVNDAIKQSLQLKGNVITMPDTKDTNQTHFRIWVIDKTKDSLSGVITFKISIKSPNGDYPTVDQDWFSGYDRGATSGTGFYGVPASISLADSSSRKLYLSETQLPDTSTRITFIVRDGSGAPISATRKTLVTFSLLQAPNGTYIFPNQDSTGQGGAVTVTVSAGNVPGITKVVAKTTDGLGNYFSAVSMPIEVAHGLPDSNQIFLNLQKNMFNSVGNQVGTLNINFADIYGNFPAPQYITFNTTGGVISPISALSDANGSASTGLYGGKVPIDPVIGFGNVSVFVKVHGGVTVTRKTPFVFSGAPIITPLSVHANDTIVISDGGYMDLYYSVADANRVPLAQGNTITVTVSGPAATGVSLYNYVNTTTGTTDTNNTTYSVRINDAIPGGGASGNFDITISVSGPNGTAIKTLKGILGASVSGYTSSIQLLAGSPSAATISVKGTGATETSTMNFVVKDSLGNPISLSKATTVLFSIIGGPNGGEFVSPTSAITDANGKVTTTVNAGTKAGVMQVVATTIINNTTITSAPVALTIASGLADPAHFTVWTDVPIWYNAIGKPIGTVYVQMGDKYGNPVQPNTALYFTATAGIITSSAFTEATGHASVIVYGGNPLPIRGIDTITVSTLGQGGIQITKKVTNIISGAPIVIVSSPNLGTIPVGGSLQINYTVADVNGNPLASGNAISVTLGGTAGAQAQLSGNTSVTITDTTRYYQFTVTNNVPQGGAGGSFTATISVNGPNGTTNLLLTGILASAVGTITAPTQIILSTESNTIIAASGTGGINTSNITFQALDAGGRAIGSAQSDTVFFTLSDTSGGAHLIPTWAMTDANGQASTKLYAGIKYGNPTITARLKTILSQPVAVRISGPSWTNFNVTISANNLPGLSQIGNAVGKLNAQIGDTLGNPVLAGTIVKFKTNGGMVDASAVTDASGSASANISGGATPNDPTIGWGNVTAQTQGDNGTILQKKIPFLFSGAPVITTLNVPSSDTLIILDAGFVDVDYIIADVNRNPLAAGNSVLVTVSGADATEIGLTNYYNFLTNGTTDINQTTFRVRISDKLPGAGTGGNFDITITVNGPNGNSIRQFHGYLRAPGAINPPSPSAKLPAQIAFVSVSSTDIYVSGTGSTETSAITYEVRDSLGSLIGTNPRAFAQFTLQFFPNTITNTGTQPRLIPNSDSTDDNARLHVSVASGTEAGVVQVYAKIDLGGGKIVTSQPVKISVHAGYADQRHFTLAPQAFNFPGIDDAFYKYPMTVQVADKYSNPVLLGTAVYFNTMHGVIGTGKSGLSSVGVTDIDGFVSQDLWSGKPYPEYGDTLNLGPGFSWVYARTLGESATWVVDSVLMLWTGAPIVSNVTGPTTFAIPNAGSAGPWTFTIADKYGHPMSPGTTITVSGTGLAISGDANLTMGDIGPDQKTFIVRTGPGITTFTVIASDADPSNAAAAPIQSALTIDINHPVYGDTKIVIATGTVD
jgi:hypothetical protein